MMPSLTRTLTVLLMVWMVGACTKHGEPVRMTSVDLGNRINDDKTISAPSETFAAGDTIYGSITTEGTGAATLEARWVAADGKVLAEQKQEINPTKLAHFEFHLAPPGGWPPGRHKVTFTLNGTGARPREFSIR